jgi:hypothetical protein
MRWRFGVLLAAIAALFLGYGSPSEAVTMSAYWATAHFDEGKQSVSFRLHEPEGTIRLYRISAPRGAKVRAFAEIPDVTVPLRIATGPTGPSSACANVGARVTCTVGEEGCPMPEATWHFRVEKLAGPAGNVIVSFRVS